MNVTVPTNNLNRSEPKKDYKRFRKMLIQIGICIAIYFSIYIIQYSNVFFSSEVIKKIETILAYDINFNEKFNQFNEYLKNNNFFKGLFTLVPQESENSILEEDTLLNTVTENSVIENNIIENKVSENGENISSSQAQNAETESNIVDDLLEENTVNNITENEVVSEALGTGGGQSDSVESITDDKQMKKDAQSIKDNYQITLPLRGTITSRFGDREIEPKFHTGIDIARNTGSEIISATNGTVILAEEQSSYGKVIKIQNKDLVVLYAHCDKILVNVGDKISMMQKIATVGSTGNSTGPHLHFEIIYCGRYVNPEYVIEFKE